LRPLVFLFPFRAGGDCACFGDLVSFSVAWDFGSEQLDGLAARGPFGMLKPMIFVVGSVLLAWRAASFVVVFLHCRPHSPF